MLPRYWSRKKDQKILMSGLELEELEKEHKVAKHDIEYYLPMEEEEILNEGIRLVYLGYFENLRPQEKLLCSSKTNGL